MTKPRILLQLDGDPQPSVFDAVVAIDAGVDHLLRHHGVAPADVRDLVHGAMFTRGGADLASTAVFIGGRDVPRAEAVMQEVLNTFFGPVRVSVMFDASGANTTAAAAVLAVASQLPLGQTTLLVLGATGPVGQRVTRLAAAEHASVRVASRSLQRAERVCESVRRKYADAAVAPLAIDSPEALVAAMQGAEAVVAAGAAGTTLVPRDAWSQATDVRVAIDLNAVPPAGIEPIEAADKGVARDGVLCYGAIGIGGTKMKIHRRAIERLFETNDLVLDAEAIYGIGKELLA